MRMNYLLLDKSCWKRIYFRFANYTYTRKDAGLFDERRWRSLFGLFFSFFFFGCLFLFFLVLLLFLEHECEYGVGLD